MTTDIIQRVLESRMCIGCGACAFAAPNSFSMEMTLEGHFQARKKSLDIEASDPAICPMSGSGNDENVIASELYPDLPANGEVGRYRSTFVCHVAEGDYRERAGSGGLITWLAAELLRQGKVDAVLHVKPVDPVTNGGLLFSYGISETTEEVLAGAKSKYYPIEMSNVLHAVRQTNKRVAVVGLPCFIKAIRLLQSKDILSKEQIPYTIGLVCGHLKSRHFANYLAWQKGGKPDEIHSFDFRYKIPGRKASDYGFSFSRSEEESNSNGKWWPMQNSKGKNWGEGQFKNVACEYCDDILAECADIAVGDAWLPGYVEDFRGTNIVVTRSKDIDALIHEAIDRHAIVSTTVELADVIRSQASGIRHRREGTAHRLQRLKAMGKWAPRKRVDPKLARHVLRRLIYDLRLRIAGKSSVLFADVLSRHGSIEDYERRMTKYLRPYEVLIKGSELAKRLFRRRKN